MCVFDDFFANVNSCATTCTLLWHSHGNDLFSFSWCFPDGYLVSFVDVFFRLCFLCVFVFCGLFVICVCFVDVRVLFLCLCFACFLWMLVFCFCVFFLIVFVVFFV